MENIIKIIKKNQLFSGVSEENIKNISKDIKYYIKTYNKGEIIAHEDDECRSLSLVLSGVVEIQRLYLNGKYIVLNRLNEGDVFGEALVFSKARTYPATVISLNESKVLFIDKSDILKILTKEEKVLENFISLLSNKVFILNSKVPTSPGLTYSSFKPVGRLGVNQLSRNNSLVLS